MHTPLRLYAILLRLIRRNDPSLIYSILLSVLMFAAFVQIERGVGSIWRSLMFVAFDMLLMGGLAAVLMAVTGRRLTSLMTAAAVVLLVWFGSNTKARFTGTAAFADDTRNLISGWALVCEFALPLVLASVAGGAILALMAWREGPTVNRAWQRILALAVAVPLFWSSVLVARNLSTERDDDLVSVGPGPKIALFFRSIYTPPDFHDRTAHYAGDFCCFHDQREPSVRFNGTQKPNIVVVLEESTFPPSNLRGVSPVSNFLMDNAAPLGVHVIGGGTWVEEYAFLHGVPPSLYGRDFIQINRLGPKLGLKGRLATILRAQGYDTHTVYPTSGDMLEGKSMHAALGIQHFHDCAAIPGCGRSTNWTQAPDSVFFDAVHRLLEDSGDKPVFVFAATLRQHSPHVQHWPLSDHQPEIVAEYLRRLDLSSREAQAFVESLRTLDRPTIVLVYGDHIPSDVAAGFSAAEFSADRFQTFFNVYDSNGAGIASSIMADFSHVDAVDVAGLDAILLRAAGFEGDYIDAKRLAISQCGQYPCQNPLPAALARTSKATTAPKEM